MRERARSERDSRPACDRLVVSLGLAAALTLLVVPGRASEEASASAPPAPDEGRLAPTGSSSGEPSSGEPSSGEPSSGEPSSVGLTGAPRLLEVGPLVGVSARFGSARGITYRPGVAVGGYVRPILTDWLGLQLYGRFESIPVDVEAGAFDWDGATLPYAFEQNPLRVTSIGAALEPNYSITRRLRIYGSAGMAWVRFDADAPSAPGFEFEATRSGIEVNVLFGLGLAYDVVERFVTLHLSTSYGVGFDQRGSAYEPLQVIDGGAMYHLAPLPEFDGMADLLLGISAAF